MPSKSLHVLVCPLDWGLGHASRCIPVIKELIAAGHKVTICGYGRSLILLQQEFPLVNSVEIQGFSPSYPDSGRMSIHLLKLLPKFIFSILNENRNLKRLISLHHFDIVISDNRYGIWNKNIKSIFITHQVMIKTPVWLKFAEYPLYLVSRLLINRFDECWIPDYNNAPGLSGDLSHKYPLPGNAKFIGPLSRFEKSENLDKKETRKIRYTAIISGPEPQRSIFENIVKRQITEINLPSTLLSGKPESSDNSVKQGNLEILSHIETEKFLTLIQSSELIICRPGYSSIMDLNAIGAKALFIPTPGQTEQFYLAKLHKQNNKAYWQTQEKLDLEVDISEALKFPGFKKDEEKSKLESVINGLKKK
jgi:uncharacterized protein (TIGR00661 family)